MVERTGLGEWAGQSLEELEACTAAHRGRVLDTVRVRAQFQARQSDQPRDRLGPPTDPVFRAAAIAADTFAALTLEPAEALSVSADWRGLPLAEIGLLRRHKNLTGHASRLVGLLPSGPARDRLVVWIDVRQRLP
ncbi:hypothetical protein [Cryptosporangium sp. NPDC051539]|uniref:hypothetical protein n=1 Tax=Cryptosporangium sp. NPDC051539 TaxID=3363962 RepID=UPI0037935ED1